MLKKLILNKKINMESLINNCIVCLYEGKLVKKRIKKSNFKWKNSIKMNQQLYCVCTRGYKQKQSN